MAILSRDPRSVAAAPVGLDRPLSLAWLSSDVLLFALLLVASVIAHLYGLGRMALHHDELIHAWMSWKFYTGAGGFICWGGRVSATYCYDPVYHGPSLYVLTLFSYFLFGDGDMQARLPQAAAGIALVASAWMLRPYLGARGALLAGVLLGFTPTLLYYTRFARHDGLMVLWTLWIVIGFFRYLDTAQPRYLYLLAVGVALALATHELYYILGFIFGWFLIIRVLYELLPRRTMTIALGSIAGIAALVELSIITGLWYGRLTPTLRADGISLLFFTVASGGLIMSRVWDPMPVFVPRFVALWQEQRTALWTALSALASIFVVLYSAFFADMRSVFDGLYAGLAYWLGSQQEYARGDQPWYYYLMLMSLYEPLAFFGGLAATVYLFTRGVRLHRQERTAQDQQEMPSHDGIETARVAPVEAETHMSFVGRPAMALFPLFLAFWFLCSLVAFSWAGEKMPWLNSHIALPANLLLAWTLARLGASLNLRTLDRRAWLVPPALILLFMALAVAFWRFGQPAVGQQRLANLLQGILALILASGLIYLIVRAAQWAGTRAALTLCTLTVAALVGAYTLRSTWLVVYDHPDTPVEPMVYTQSTPDTPLIVAQIRDLAISQTRNARSVNDPTGGLSMPVIMDRGDPAQDGEGSLAWPYQWYLRDFKRLETRSSDDFRSATPDTFLVDPPQGAGERILAPVVMVSRVSLNSNAQQALEANYVRLYDTKLNWWFPEGNKCDPQSPGYKRFYFAYPGSAGDIAKACPGLQPQDAPPVWAPIFWIFDSSHWANTGRYLLYRELPPPLRLDGREMSVWVRRDLARVGEAPAVAATSSVIKLVATDIFGEFGSEPGQLIQPRGVAVDPQGNIIVSDSANHRLIVFDPSGTPIRTIGEFGNGDGQFYEPRGVAVDAAGNIYVADTWNARIVKLDSQGTFLASWGVGREDFGDGRRASPTGGTQEQNLARPLDFFGPRGVAVDAEGNVYIADTGNKRIVVTDSDGNYKYQWGYDGSAAGQFNEPIGVAIDENGTVFVADTWNSRVQAFARGENGQVDPLPYATWRIPGWQPQTYEDPFIAARGRRVVISVPLRNILMLTDDNGIGLLAWGGSGSNVASVRQPCGVAFAPDDSVIVVDRGNARIMRFSLPNVAPPTTTNGVPLQ
ncbi:MAG: TIGR03663 family protein [Roseiflexaceae bacterium]|nr:TIGR03663 family protein [Roseiflexaceae bacterium]